MKWEDVDAKLRDLLVSLAYDAVWLTGYPASILPRASIRFGLRKSDGGKFDVEVSLTREEYAAARDHFGGRFEEKT